MARTKAIRFTRSDDCNMVITNLGQDNLYSGVIVTQLLRDCFNINRPRVECCMQFLNEKALLAALHIIRHPMALQGL